MVILKCVPCIYYSVFFDDNKIYILFDSGNGVNTININYV